MQHDQATTFYNYASFFKTGFIFLHLPPLINTNFLRLSCQPISNTDTLPSMGNLMRLRGHEDSAVTGIPVRVSTLQLKVLFRTMLQ